MVKSEHGVQILIKSGYKDSLSPNLSCPFNKLGLFHVVRFVWGIPNLGSNIGIQGSVFTERFYKKQIISNRWSHGTMGANYKGTIPILILGGKFSEALFIGPDTIDISMGTQRKNF